ncbi:hypothetical protein H4R34_003866 [Dimargaris verticillata]|uniref:tRNA pseudouridine(55) synthase n=1 Tax=Dimargaris verticillata TaxID=2761393 RepID=A0A9W8AZX1_9FUNG|nr:hypothetical protein H4R34_003866 [Dimargaris verticillata]
MATSRLQESEHTPQTFDLQLQLPVVMIARAYAFHQWLQAQLPDSTVSLPDLKLLARSALRAVLAQALDLPCQPESEFAIRLTFTHPALAHECAALWSTSTAPNQNDANRSRHLPRPMTLDKVLAQMKSLTRDELNQAGYLPPPPVADPCTLHDISFHQASLYLAGRYNKYARDISQTPFAADGRQLAQTSVSETISQPAQLVFKADEVKFVASGREDMDVRMLGNGRPFYLELLNPKQMTITAAALDDLTRAINQTSQIQVSPLCLVTKSNTCLIKDGEESKAKTYACLVWTEQVLTDAVLAKLAPLHSGFDIQQQTPLRVLHRRAQLTRPKRVHGMAVKPLADHFVTVTLCAEAGTYIKEFIHGDCARSAPSFAQMVGCRVDLLELDVVQVDLQWPPSL